MKSAFRLVKIQSAFPAMKEIKRFENSTFVSVFHLHAWKVAPCEYPAQFTVILLLKTMNISFAINHIPQQSECSLEHIQTRMQKKTLNENIQSR